MLKRMLVLFIIPLLFACRIKEDRTSYPEMELTVTNWNLQTFFDGNNDGIEYSEFRMGKEVWNEDFYIDRLTKLCKIIEELDSDIFVMEEIENEKVLYDISNYLSHNCWFKKKMYDFAAFYKEPESSIGCGVISKIPITEVKTHAIDVRTEKEKAPDMRALMEVSFLNSGKAFSMLINHWKSKSGGEEKSNKWRLWQEGILQREMAKLKDSSVFAAGDFNRDISEFTRNDAFELYFSGIDYGEKSVLNVFSPWDFVSENDCGSYFFKGKWERIDHFFSAEKELLREFKVEAIPELLKADGTPDRYQIFTHKGYSDHLPVSCKIRLG